MAMKNLCYFYINHISSEWNKPHSSLSVKRHPQAFFEIEFCRYFAATHNLQCSTKIISTGKINVAFIWIESRHLAGLVTNANMYMDWKLLHYLQVFVL